MFASTLTSIDRTQPTTLTGSETKLTSNATLRWIGTLALVLAVSCLFSGNSTESAASDVAKASSQDLQGSTDEKIVIVGIGNSGNHFHRVETSGVSRTLAEIESIPEVTDDVLRKIHEAILQKACLGDVQAAHVIVRIAKFQREQNR
jgi:hypothetical protein